ncbi:MULTISPECIES: 2-hydroxyacid dehydrogenase [Chelativorans]|jgi:lactate dehydrogenase-like 2-hydroxyacid dehydrogenase|uniref:D-isomer specific 2-hydroxyacid dehydrogenase, NAD-binding protein n=1 Tax=Chelativorans sp. (strain BNC1) TaxID=266779 RepID=Q11BV4_CHESB|nr:MULTISPECIES: 2-hydroxyacid dehydrogenase [Chelativorans]
MDDEIVILQATSLPAPTVNTLREHFSVLELPSQGAERDRLIEANRDRIRGIATLGAGPVDAALIGRLPALEIIACFSAGMDGIDLEAAKARNIAVTNTSPVLADDVADLAVVMLFSLLRGISRAERYARAGLWPDGNLPLARTVRGCRVGIIGLGHIGKAVARRLECSGAEIAYNGPRRKPDSAYTYFPSLIELANWSDALIVCCPGGEETRNLVGSAILEALGPEGWLVNVARGSVVDEAALVKAVVSGRIAGAALDVFAKEPHVPAELRDKENVIVLPHIGSATRETRDAMGLSMIASLRSHFRH